MNYETSDINIAAYLKMKGKTITHIRRNGKRAIFCFDNSAEECRPLVIDFKNDLEGFNSFLHAWQDLKTLSYAG